jgi:hypothetical protein
MIGLLALVSFSASSLIQVVIALVIVGVVLWLLEQLPVENTIRVVIKVVVILAVCIWLLRTFGLV